MSREKIVKMVPLTSVDMNTLVPGYNTINPGGLPVACFLMRLTNSAVVDVQLEIEVVPGPRPDNDFILRRTEDAHIYDLWANGTGRSDGRYAAFQKGTTILVRGGKGVGSLYLSAYYLENK